MKFLIYGSNGWIGGMFVDILERNGENVVKGLSRVNNTEDLEKEILEVKPDRVVSMIGRTHGLNFNSIDYLEQEGKLRENIQDNLFSPLMLSIICNKFNIHLTYLGTGCIFSYENNEEEVFNEDSNPNFFGSSYSVVKGFTDMMIKQFDNVLNLRIRMPISDESHPRDFITKISNYQKIINKPNSVTVLSDILPIMYDMSKNGLSGTYNMVNPESISHCQILDMYKDIIDKDFTYEVMTEEEQDKLLLSKRSNNTLTTEKILEKYNIPTSKESITRILNYRKKY